MVIKKKLIYLLALILGIFLFNIGINLNFFNIEGQVGGWEFAGNR